VTARDTRTAAEVAADARARIAQRDRTVVKTVAEWRKAEGLPPFDQEPR
jgi:hypothetical protein